ncbi:hypothetical protein EDD11_008799, partial [Mortierella claussenii]
MSQDRLDDEPGDSFPPSYEEAISHIADESAAAAAAAMAAHQHQQQQHRSQSSHAGGNGSTTASPAFNLNDEIQNSGSHVAPDETDDNMSSPLMRETQQVPSTHTQQTFIQPTASALPSSNSTTSGIGATAAAGSSSEANHVDPLDADSHHSSYRDDHRSPFDRYQHHQHHSHYNHHNHHNHYNHHHGHPHMPPYRRHDHHRSPTDPPVPLLPGFDLRMAHFSPGGPFMPPFSYPGASVGGGGGGGGGGRAGGFGRPPRPPAPPGPFGASFGASDVGRSPPAFGPSPGGFGPILRPGFPFGPVTSGESSGRPSSDGGAFRGLPPHPASAFLYHAPSLMPGLHPSAPSPLPGPGMPLEASNTADSTHSDEQPPPESVLDTATSGTSLSEKQGPHQATPAPPAPVSAPSATPSAPVAPVSSAPLLSSEPRTLSEGARPPPSSSPTTSSSPSPSSFFTPATFINGPSLTPPVIPLAPTTANTSGLMTSLDISKATFSRSKRGVESRDAKLDDPYQLYRFIVAHNDRPLMHVMIT